MWVRVGGWVGVAGGVAAGHMKSTPISLSHHPISTPKPPLILTTASAWSPDRENPTMAGDSSATTDAWDTHVCQLGWREAPSAKMGSHQVSDFQYQQSMVM